MESSATSIKRKVAIIATYPPRMCGIGSFTKCLRDALCQAAPELDITVVAVDRDGLAYDKGEVSGIIRQDKADDYVTMANKLADDGVEAVLIQHEYGIYGGSLGAYATLLTDQLTRRRVPYTLTLHTLLSQPSLGQRTILRRLCSNAAKVLVFTETARKIAIFTGVSKPDVLEIVPHGAPDTLMRTGSPCPDDAMCPEIRKLLKELAGRPILSTFGLIGEGKGLEVAIAALPEVIKRHKDVCYLIAGVSHPEEKRKHGETYREFLQQKIKEVGVEKHVRFIDSFLKIEEVAELLHNTDLYVTPYRSKEQICSGALTFALTAGCPVVSTPYYYAEDMLKGGAGVLVPFNDTHALAEAINNFLDKPDALQKAHKKAMKLSAQLSWPAVARRMADLVVDLQKPKLGRAAITKTSDVPSAPPLKLDHIQRMTTDDGIYQFANRDKPSKKSGYCVDDVARLGNIAAGLATAGIAVSQATAWIKTTLKFLEESYDPDQLGLRNMRTNTNVWLDEPHMGDHVGRAMWALGDIAAAPISTRLRLRARNLLTALAMQVTHLPHLRPSALAILGLGRQRELSEQEQAMVTVAATRLDAAYIASSRGSWHWYEPQLTYDNARLPQAVIIAAEVLGDPVLLQRGLEALEWYAEQCNLPLGKPQTEWWPVKLVGNKWRTRRQKDDDASEGDEQPIDATALSEALVEAWRVTGDKKYADAAHLAFNWFLGCNHSGKWLYDPFTGGGQDGLKPDSVNRNMGAESTLAYYQALLALANAELVTFDIVNGIELVELAKIQAPAPQRKSSAKGRL